jgi:hypothetical protein
VATVSPAATEVCGNGVDDNCSNAVDDNPTQASWVSWYRDDDNDGYGQTANAVSACAAINGRVATGGDCNDQDSGINPGASEVCTGGIDEDCDNSTDCDDSNCYLSNSCSSNSIENNHTQCNNGIDDDGDGFIDCYDCDCSYLTTLCNGYQCQGGYSGGSSTSENTDSTCSDNSDNDTDGLIDCCDPDCGSTTWCNTAPPQGGAGSCNSTGYEVCLNTGLSEDNDIAADCNDSDCHDVFTPACVSTTTADSLTGNLAADDELFGGDCGGMHTCVLAMDLNAITTPVCWGDDSKGQSTIPTSLSLVSGEEYAGIATGGLHTCVAINDTISYTSRVECWGDNSLAQSAGIQIMGPSIEGITAGVAHTCVLTSMGEVRCWGDSTHGAATPPTGGNSYFSSIDAGGYHTCGILSHSASDPNGIVCWGRNDVLQAGSDTPHEFDYVAAGDLHTCGVTSSSDVNHPDTVLCWGNDTYGQTSNKPMATATVDYDRITSSGHHTCVEILDADGNGNSSLECWGWGDPGGNGTHDNQTNTASTAHPTVSGGTYLGFCAGGRHTFSAGHDGTNNVYGFAGDTSSGQNRCSNTITCP